MTALQAYTRRVYSLWRLAYPDGPRDFTGEAEALARALPRLRLSDGVPLALCCLAVIGHESGYRTCGLPYSWSPPLLSPPTDLGPGQITLPSWRACQRKRDAVFVSGRRSHDARVVRALLAPLDYPHETLLDHRTSIAAVGAVLFTKYVLYGAATGSKLLQLYGGSKWAIR